MYSTYLKKIFAHVCMAALYYTSMYDESLFKVACVLTAFMTILSVVAIFIQEDELDELTPWPIMVIVCAIWIVFAIITPAYHGHYNMSLFNTLAIIGFRIKGYIVGRSKA